MSAFWGHLVGVNIAVLMLIFVGIWIWAWLPYHKQEFDELAQLPMHDDDDGNAQLQSKDKTR